jgi:group I intron endonuclease
MTFTSGVYQIRNTRTGSRYIGSTVNFENRRKDHFAALKLGKHNRRFQAAYDSEENKLVFLFEIIAVYSSDLIREIEQILLDKLRPEYNVNPLASGLGNWKEFLSEEELYQISIRNGETQRKVQNDPEVNKRRSESLIESNKKPAVIKRRSDAAKRAFSDKNLLERRTSTYVKKYGRKVRNLDLDITFASIEEARRYFGFTKEVGIGRCCRGRYKSAGGYRWEYI